MIVMQGIGVNRNSRKFLQKYRFVHSNCADFSFWIEVCTSHPKVTYSFLSSVFSFTIHSTKSVPKYILSQQASKVLILCVEFWELSHLTRDLCHAENKITVFTSGASAQNDNFDHFE